MYPDPSHNCPSPHAHRSEITFYLGYEATRHLKTVSHPVETPMGVKHEGVDLHHGGHCIIPILRAGLAMGDGMMELLPDAGTSTNRASYVLYPIHHVCVYVYVR